MFFITEKEFKGEWRRKEAKLEEKGEEETRRRSLSRSREDARSWICPCPSPGDIEPLMSAD